MTTQEDQQHQMVVDEKTGKITNITDPYENEREKQM
jgi:hypothetical protein